MYTITLDSAKIFECTLKLKGVNIKNSKINLVIESPDIDIRCRGTINENGKVNIPIKKLKGILEENYTGKLYLEVIVDDNYFIPFKNEYITEVSKKVDLLENTKINITENNLQFHSEKIIKNILTKNINIFKSEHKSLVIENIKNYITSNNIKENQYSDLMNIILTELTNKLS